MLLKGFRAVAVPVLMGVILLPEVVAPLAAAAEPVTLTERIDAEVSKVLPRITELRHQIHQYPELGNREFKTAELAAGHLRELGFEVTTGVAHTGVVAVLRGGRPGGVVAVRADMDALPVTEETPYPFRSTVRTQWKGEEVGVMHACGHDIHTAVQLGVASVLAALRTHLPGTVLFLFQPAEEGPPEGEEGGAELMLAQGVFDKLRPGAVLGLHTFAEMEVGTVGYTVGPAFAAVDHFRITLRGRQAHGAHPDQSVDPIVLAAQVVLAFQTIPSRTLSPLDPSVVTVGILRGGQRFNIIPAEVKMEGTVRTYAPEVRDTIQRRMGEILDGLARAAGASFDLDYERGSPATINDPDLARRLVPTLERVLGPEVVHEIPPTMGGEDFAYFANEVPGFYFRLGTVKPGATSGGHHTPTFMADDGSLPVGIRAMANLIVDYLQAAAR